MDSKALYLEDAPGTHKLVIRRFTCSYKFLNQQWKAIESSNRPIVHILYMSRAALGSFFKFLN